MENCDFIPQKSDLMLKMFLRFQKMILIPVIKLLNQQYSPKRSSSLSQTSNTFKSRFLHPVSSFQSRFRLVAVGIMRKDARLHGPVIEPATFGPLTSKATQTKWSVATFKSCTLYLGNGQKQPSHR